MKQVGVIGLGSIGMRHAKNLREIDAFDGINVIGYDPNKPIDGLNSSTLNEILDICQIVVIASPTPNHEAHLSTAIARHKHVFIEKPIGDTNKFNIAAALEDAKKENLVVFCGYNNRFHACVKQAKQWLSEGKIGNPIWASVTLAQYSEKEPYLRDGVTSNWSHELDLALYLLGPAKVSAASMRVTNGSDDMADIILVHESGARSNIHLDYLVKPEIRATTIVGTEGRLAIDLVSRWACLVTKDGQRTEHQFHDSFDENYVEEIRAFLDRIEGKETLGCDGQEGLAVLEIILEAKRMAGLS